MQFTRVMALPGMIVPVKSLLIGLRMLGLDRTEIEAPPSVSELAMFIETFTKLLIAVALATEIMGGEDGQPAAPLP
jgi:hypothetical protein